ncbi:MAG: GNAT family N-acetyltransferase [Cellulomonadaceae bacterium]
MNPELTCDSVHSDPSLADCSHSVHFLVRQTCSRSLLWFRRRADQRVIVLALGVGVSANPLIPRGNKPLNPWSAVPATLHCFHHDALTRTLDKSNEIFGQHVQGEPAGFGGLFRLPRADGGGRALCASCLVDERSLPTSAEFEKQTRTSPAPRSIGLLAAERKGTDAVIGYCGLIETADDPAGEPELAFELLRRFWGQGLATEAAWAVVGWARASSHRRLWATVREWTKPL